MTPAQAEQLKVAALALVADCVRPDPRTTAPDQKVAACCFTCGARAEALSRLVHVDSCPAGRVLMAWLDASSAAPGSGRRDATIAQGSHIAYADGVVMTHEEAALSHALHRCWGAGR